MVEVKSTLPTDEGGINQPKSHTAGARRTENTHSRVTELGDQYRKSHKSSIVTTDGKGGVYYRERQ